MRISDLEKNYDKFSLAINHMEIRQGEIHGLIGSNGCGKTTLLKVISGILKPDSGEIDRCGLTGREITMVSGKPYIMHDTVYNNLIYPLKLRKGKPDRERTEQLLELVRLQDMRQSYAPALSTGERQKLAMIRALLFSPKMFLIDEAFSGIDIEGVRVLENFIMEEQKKTDSTWLVVSHQLSRIQRLCSHVFFMYGGSLEWEGNTEEVFGYPDHEHLRLYLQCETVAKL